MVTYSKGLALQSAPRGMDKSAKTLPPLRLCFCPEKREDMKVGYDPIITPQKEEGAWVGICRDGRLLAATLLLALLSSSFTAMSLYQLAALQADLMSLRMELQSYRGSATPTASGAPGLTAGVKVSSSLLCLCRRPWYATLHSCPVTNWLSLFLAPDTGSSSTPQL